MDSVALLDLPSPLLHWLPDETFFSLVSRHHAFWGYSNAAETAVILFGHRHRGTHHDFPSALDQFVARTVGEFGQSADLALNRTLLRYYHPFAPQRLIMECGEMMRSHAVTHLKFRLGLLTSGFRANHPLKSCASCIAQDRRETGWSYWHLEHQYPGVWFCDRHDEPLYESTIKSTGVNRFQWALPEIRNSTQQWLANACDVSALKKLSQMTAYVVRESRSAGWLGGEQVVPVLRDTLRQKGWLTPNGSLRIHALESDYLTWCQRLRGPLELGALPAELTQARIQVSGVLRNWRTRPHPLRVLVAASWLFDSPEGFIAACDRFHAGLPLRSSSGAMAETIPAYCRSDRDCLKSELIARVLSGASASAAASSVGVAVGTALTWLAHANVKVARRPKTLKPEIQSALKMDLEKGIDKASAAAAHGVSVQAVTRYLRTEPGLYQVWKGAVFKNMQNKAREGWHVACERYGHLGTKLTRANAPSSYAWLHRNDRVWLQSNLSAIRDRPSVRSSVNWDHRDLALCAALESVVERLRADQGNRALQLWQLYQALPQLKPKLSKLHKLPLTRRAIERALSRQRAEPTQGLF